MKKECNVCWMAALGGIAIAFFGFAVLVHGWPWAAGHNATAPTFTDWLTAVGTIASAAGAVIVALVGRIKQKSDERAGSLRYAASNVDTLMYSHLKLREALRHIPASSRFRDKRATEASLREAATILKSIDVERIGISLPRTADIISSASMFIAQARFDAQRLPGSSVGCTLKLKQGMSNLASAWNSILYASTAD